MTIFARARAATAKTMYGDLPHDSRRSRGTGGDLEIRVLTY